MPPNAFQVWQARTNLTAIPWCADRGCTDWFVNHALPNQSDITNTIVSRLRCSSDVFVPDYLVDSVGNLTSVHTYNDPDGDLRFAHRVCTCDGAMMYGGEDCTPQGAGVIYVVLLLATWIWILGLTLRALYLLAGGTIKKRSKQVLVVLAIIQKLGQLGWFFDMNMTSLIVAGNGDRVLVAGLCFVVSILCLFAFLCGMVFESVLILEQQTRKKSHLRTLRLLKRFLAVVPLAVCGVAIWAMPFRDETTPVMAGAFGVLAIFIGTAFSVIISILDHRLHRFSAKGISGRPSTPVHSVVPSERIGSGGNLHIMPQTTTVDTNAVSKRLRSLASALRLVLLLNIVFSASLVSVVVMGGEQLAILELPCFVVWQIAQACIPMVGVSGLAVHARERLAKRMSAVNGLHLHLHLHPHDHHHHHEHLETVNSSDCGTLTS
jgi:hypothetical protein